MRNRCPVVSLPLSFVADSFVIVRRDTEMHEIDLSTARGATER